MTQLLISHNPTAILAEELAHVLSEIEPYKTSRKYARLLEHPRIADFPLASNICANRARNIALPDPRRLERVLRVLDSESVSVDLNQHPILYWQSPDIRFPDYDVKLGCFDVEYRLDTGECYAVACNPNPAACDEDCTHPHIDDDHVCLGDKFSLLRELAVSGRLPAVVDSLNSLLATYNPDSPYVKLENWVGFPCTMCGDVVSESMFCNCCESNCCEDCVRYSDYNDEYLCDNCAFHCDCGECCRVDDAYSCDCPNCDNQHCPRCLER